MNRRDMIIVATLMNTGLLAVLFMMAIQSDNSASSESPEVTQPIPQAQVAESTIPSSVLEPILPQDSSLPLAKTSRHDELDKVINTYANVVPPTPVIMDDDLFQDESTQEPLVATAPREVHHVGNVEAPVQVASSDSDVEVTVKRGDSLDKIARANKTSIKALKRANNLANDRLKIGQVLKIPKGSDADEPKVQVAKAARAEPVAAAAGTEFYTIKNGDNPWKIAKQFGVRFDQLLKLNGLDEAKARRLKAGDKIRVR